MRRIRLAVQEVLRDIRIASRIIRDPRCPLLAKLLLGLAVAYAASPIDLVPDFIPLFGHLDDLVVVPLLISAALALAPSEVIREHKEGLRQVQDGG